jgi:hypothetical protein
VPVVDDDAATDAILQPSSMTQEFIRMRAESKYELVNPRVCACSGRSARCWVQYVFSICSHTYTCADARKCLACCMHRVGLIILPVFSKAVTVYAHAVVTANPNW